MRAIVGGFGEVLEAIVRIVHYIRNVRHGAVDTVGSPFLPDGADRGICDERPPPLPGSSCRWPEATPSPHRGHQRADLRLAETPAAGNDGPEHRLHVGGEAVDTRRSPGGRSSARASSATARSRASSSLEQADVLEGDHRLVGERLSAARSACRRRGSPRLQRRLMVPTAAPSRRSRGTARPVRKPSSRAIA